MAEVRLQKVMAAAGLGSRRACEEMIAAGVVQVNGQTVTELGTRVDPDSARITVEGKPLALPERHIYVKVHKPRGVISDIGGEESDRQSVADLLPPELGRVFPVGRLDLHSEGLVLLTDDGELAHRLTHPRYEHPKTYLVLVDKLPDTAALERLRNGIDLPEGRTAPAKVRAADGLPPALNLSKGPTQGVWLEVTLHEGKKRQIRHMVAAVGYQVLRLVRWAIGPLTLGSLGLGQYALLKQGEIAALRKLAGLSAPPAAQEDERDERDERPRRSGPPRRAGAPYKGAAPRRAGAPRTGGGRPPAGGAARSGAGRTESARAGGEGRRYSSDRPRDDRPRDDRPSSEGRRYSSDRPRDDRPREDRPSSEGRRYSSDRPRDDRPRDDRPREDRPSSEGRRYSSDRPRDDRPRDDRPRSGRPSGGSRPYSSDRPRDDRPAGDSRPDSGDRPRDDRPAGEGGGSTRRRYTPVQGRDDRPRDDRPRDDRPRDDRPAGARKPYAGKPSGSGKPYSGKPYSGKPSSGGKPSTGGKPYGGKPSGGGKPYGGKPSGSGKPYSGKPYSGKPSGGKPRKSQG